MADEFEGERTIGRCYLNAKCDPGIVVPVFQLLQVAPAQVLPEETDIAELFFRSRWRRMFRTVCVGRVFAENE